MRIKYVNNNSEDHVERNLGKSLIRAGLAVAVGPEDAEESTSRLPKYQPAAVVEPEWEVTVHNGHQGGKTLCIRMTLPNLVLDYFGPPDAANSRREWDGGCRWLNGFGRAVPEEIVKLYKRQYKDNPSLRGSGWALPAGVSTGPSNESQAAVQKQMDDREVAVSHELSKVVG